MEDEQLCTDTNSQVYTSEVYGDENDSIADCIEQMRLEMADKKKNKRPLHSLTSFDGSCRTKVAKYLSTGAYEELEVNNDNVEQYLYVAKELGHIDLKNYCEDELLKQLLPEVSLDMMQIANGYDLNRLKEKCLKLIESKFSSLWMTEDFQYLGKNDIIMLISLPKIKTNPYVFDAIEYWCDYEREFRLDAYNEMNDLLNITEKCAPEKKMCSKYHRYVAMFTYDQDEKLPKVLVMDVEKFSTMSMHIRKIGHIDPDFAVCCQQKDVTEAPYVYLMGNAGSAGKHINHVFKFDVVLSKWKELHGIKERRQGYALVCVDNNLYVLGGLSVNKEGNVPEIEERKPTKQWKEIGHLKQSVRSPACVVHNDNIYLFGGTLNGGEYSTVVQCFNVSTHQTKIVSHLPSSISGGEGVVLGDKIYVITEQGALFIFDPLSNTCTEGATHAHALSHFAIFTDDVDIFTAGGVCGDTKCVSDIYKYFVDLDRWEKMNTVLPFPMAVKGYCKICMQSDIAMIPLID